MGSSQLIHVCEQGTLMGCMDGDLVFFSGLKMNVDQTDIFDRPMLANDNFPMVFPVATKTVEGPLKEKHPELFEKEFVGVTIEPRTVPFSTTRKDYYLVAKVAFVSEQIVKPPTWILWGTPKIIRQEEM